ncbi:hypothetical protein PPRY_a3111 [Pseudoalteromonas prydzensis ACAM 620]|nr:hypothetical protein [Pseudoalteromonas prydzensis ACAM 620]
MADVESVELLFFNKNSLFYGFQNTLPNTLNTLRVNYRSSFFN